jgi:pleiotropic regulator 1
LSAVYALALHPTLDVLLTGGRDASCRVWDMRTRTAIHVLTGHENAVSSILANSADPQVVTGSMDSTVRTWDLAAGKVRSVLTHHKKAVRALAGHGREFAFVSASVDAVKRWALPDCTFVHGYGASGSIVNALALNDDGVLVGGGDDGTLQMWDYGTGYAFHSAHSKPQPGSLDAEAGIYAALFDVTGSRLITAEADKTIKIWKEDPEASPETHPIDMASWEETCRAFKRY